MGRTALHIATLTGHKGISSIKALLDSGSDINAQDKEGNTPLHIATSKEDVKLVKFLLERGADRNLRNYSGELSGSAGTVINHRKREQILSLLADNGPK